MSARPQLTRDRIIDAAARVADERGLSGVSMRTVAAALGVQAMSLYHHVSNKDGLLDGLADVAFTKMYRPTPKGPWRPEMTHRARSARRTLAAHPWALGLIESRRQPGPASLQYHDAVLGCLRHSGFTVALAAHAYSVLDAYVYGFVLTELNLPMEPGESTEAFVADLALPLEQYPHLAEMIVEQVGHSYDYGNEFEYGLEIIMDGLARAKALL